MTLDQASLALPARYRKIREKVRIYDGKLKDLLEAKTELKRLFILWPSRDLTTAGLIDQIKASGEKLWFLIIDLFRFLGREDINELEKEVCEMLMEVLKPKMDIIRDPEYLKGRYFEAAGGSVEVYEASRTLVSIRAREPGGLIEILDGVCGGLEVKMLESESSGVDIKSEPESEPEGLGVEIKLEPED